MPDSQGVVLTNKANKVEGKHIHNYSTFSDSLSYRLYNTLRFGDYTPSFVMDGVEKDSISVNTKDIIDSLSLKAPFKGSVRKIKESFMVPLMSILPMNWDRIYVQPSNGDDVPDDANCVLVDFPTRFANFWKSMWTAICSNVPVAPASESDPDVTDAQVRNFYTALFRALVAGENVYSYGSLLNVCGYKISDTFTIVYNSKYNSYDDFFDFVISTAFKHIKYFRVGWLEGSSTLYRDFLGLSSEAPSSAGNHSSYSSFRSFLEFVRENPLAYIYSMELDSSLSDNNGLADFLYDELGDVFSATPGISTPPSTEESIDSVNDTNLNLSRLLAYQIVCAHFYSNSSIDVIYTAELYRQYLEHVFFLAIGSSAHSVPAFDFNGISCQYDFLSGKMLGISIYRNSADTSAYSFNYDTLCNRDTASASYARLYRLVAIAAIFGFRKSLRYGDYFVGARPRPLAPINTDVSVNDNLVSVVDITQKIQVQRFANSVMRSRQKIEEYVKSLFGSAPAPDYHNPFFLSREVEHIFGDEVQNTAESQVTNANSRTALLSSNVGQFTFTFHNDDNHPCIYLQIISFDIKRAYTRSVERQFFIANRFDMFNPDFQYIGDQAVFGMELGFRLQNGTIPKVFGYQTRDEEYKQRFDQASGGFVNNLPGWILTDKDLNNFNNNYGHISPDFIRSYNTEFDQFFLSLTGLSLGNYFHFICITNNNVNAKRAMAVDPQILQ